MLFQLRVGWNTGTGTGNLRIGSLPFASSSNGPASAVAIYPENVALTAGNIAVAVVVVGESYIGIDQVPTGGGAAVAVPYDAAGELIIAGHYYV